MHLNEEDLSRCVGYSNTSQARLREKVDYYCKDWLVPIAIWFLYFDFDSFSVSSYINFGWDMDLKDELDATKVWDDKVEQLVGL